MLLRCLLALGLLLRPTQADITDNEAHRVAIAGFFGKEGYMKRAFSRAIRDINQCFFSHEFCDLIKPCKQDVKCDEFHHIQFAALMYEIEDDLLEAAHTFGQLDKWRSRKNKKNEYGLSAIIGPHYEASSKIIQGLCELHDLPHIVVRPELYHDRLRSINLYPDIHVLSGVYMEMVKKLNWTSFTILYEKGDNFLALENVLKMYGPLDHEISAFHLGDGPDYSPVLLRAKDKGVSSIMIECSQDRLDDVLKQLQEVGMMTGFYKYIITSLDLQTVDMRAYQHSGVNITGFRMVIPTDPLVQKYRPLTGRNDSSKSAADETTLRIQEALMFDAIALFTQSYKDLAYNFNMEGYQIPTDYLNDTKEPWEHGLSLRSYIIHNTVNGLSGPVMLDSDGRRRRFRLELLNLRTTGLTTVGSWNPDDGFDNMNLKNEIALQHFDILITLTPPYGMRVNYSKNLQGNDRYEGFVVDLIKELSQRINFNYTFHVHEDTSSGNCKDTDEEVCKCDGMLGKIRSGAMHMAITDLTITKDRARCVDFSTPFMNLGMSILYKKPTKAPATLFSFLLPFDKSVWLNLAGMYLIVALLFTVVGRLSPSEWTNPYPCIQNPTKLVNQFSVNNSIWFCGGSILQQGSEIAPIAPGPRVLSSFWFFYCLIMTATYTANLTSFLTVETPTIIVRGIDDLYNQTKIKFGAKANGSTHSYFLSSKNPKHKKIAERMTDPEWAEKYMVKDNDKGIKLALEENYAFFMESSSIKYIKYRYCNLDQAGGYIDQKSYAIAYPKNFEYHQLIDRGISELQEKLVIKNLEEKWWEQKGATCTPTEENNETQPMNLDQLSGAFAVLVIGTVLSGILIVVEFYYNAKKITKKENVNIISIIFEEIQNLLKHKSVKPVLRRNKSTDSTISDTYSCDFTMTTQG